MNSARTFWVSRVSRLNTGVRLTKVGMPIVRMYDGRNDPRPASEYPHADESKPERTPSAQRKASARRSPRSRRLGDNDADKRSFPDHDLADRFPRHVTPDHRVGERQLAELIVGRVGRRGHAGANLAVDLHRHDDFVG